MCKLWFAVCNILFVVLYLFLIKRMNRFIMPLVSGMAAKPPRNNL